MDVGARADASAGVDVGARADASAGVDVGARADASAGVDVGARADVGTIWVNPGARGSYCYIPGRSGSLGPFQKFRAVPKVPGRRGNTCPSGHGHTRGAT